MPDWPKVLQELSLCRTTAELAETVERMAVDFGARDPRFHLYEMRGASLVRGTERLPVDASSLPGSCALYCEKVTGPQGAALPAKRFGSLVGVLEAREGADALEPLAGAAGMLLEVVRHREQSRKCVEVLRGLVVELIDQVAPGGRGHVSRVARVATELATLMDLSVQSRQELWDAAYYHDVGWLTDGAEHARAGAALLERSPALKPLSRLVASHHLRYPAEANLPVEAWLLALAEDLDELFTQRRHLPLSNRIEEFYSERAPHHHPEAVDALSGLVDSGRLAEIYA